MTRPAPTDAERDFAMLAAKLAAETIPVRRRILIKLIDATLDRALAQR